MSQQVSQQENLKAFDKNLNNSKQEDKMFNINFTEKDNWIEPRTSGIGSDRSPTEPQPLSKMEVRPSI